MAADYVAERLHDNIFNKMEDCVGNEEQREAVKAGYLKTDEDFLTQVFNKFILNWEASCRLNHLAS